MPLCRRAVLCTLVASLGLSVVTATRAENNWPQWRGSAGTGHTSEKNLPIQWNEGDIVWRAEIGGRGQSSPIVWERRIYLTTASTDGKTRSVVCLNRDTGKELWRQDSQSENSERLHNMNSYASATCATDGQRVVAFFGRGGIHCYDMNGKPLWSRNLGTFEGPWGTGASPLIVDDLIIQNCDAEDEAFLIGLNKTTGETVWKTPRQNIRGWSTPVLIDTGARRELVINGHVGMTSYDPVSGKQLWFVDGCRGRGTPTVAPAGDMVVAVSGRGDMVAVRTGGSGRINESHEVWRVPRRGGRDLPSPIVVGDFLLVVSLRPGIATCYEVATGEQLWKERLEGQFSSSPIAVGDLTYIPNEDGETFVIRPGKKFDLVARNLIKNDDGEIFRGAITPHSGQMLIRSDRALYCVGRRGAE